LHHYFKNLWFELFLHIEILVMPGMVVHACNPRKLIQEDCEFQASLGYTAGPCVKKQTKQNKKHSQIITFHLSTDS
jgi:hypothetical protein